MTKRSLTENTEAMTSKDDVNRSIVAKMPHNVLSNGEHTLKIISI